MAGANLNGAYFDAATLHYEAQLTDNEHGPASLADVRWNGANIAWMNWGTVNTLQPEHRARKGKITGEGRLLTSRDARDREFRSAVRAYRQVATLLREQGLNEDADRFAYRAQILQRQVLRRQGQLLRYLGSLFLDLISGYGYRPLHSFITYLLVVVGFAVAYFLLGQSLSQPLEPLAALVFSVTSFHGRGFSPGANVGLTNPLAVLAAGEAVIGLLIEITFIATFTQRFFAR